MTPALLCPGLRGHLVTSCVLAGHQRPLDGCRRIEGWGEEGSCPGPACCGISALASRLPPAPQLPWGRGNLLVCSPGVGLGESGPEPLGPSEERRKGQA